MERKYILDNQTQKSQKISFVLSLENKCWINYKINIKFKYDRYDSCRNKNVSYTFDWNLIILDVKLLNYDKKLYCTNIYSYLHFYFIVFYFCLFLMNNDVQQFFMFWVPSISSFLKSLQIIWLLGSPTFCYWVVGCVYIYIFLSMSPSLEIFIYKNLPLHCDFPFPLYKEGFGEAKFLNF